MSGYDALATRLRAAYNPRTDRADWTHPGTSARTRGKWVAVAQAALRVASTDPEVVAAALHRIFVADIPEQRDYGWPPRTNAERERWLAVADAYLEWAAKAEPVHPAWGHEWIKEPDPESGVT